MNRTSQFSLVFAIGLCAGLSAQHWWRGVEESAIAPATAAIHSDVGHPSKVHASRSAYVCPMHADVVRGEPGRCPICGMDLVKRPDSSATHEHETAVAPAMLRQLGIRTSPVERGSITRAVNAPGYSTIGAGGPVGIYAQEVGPGKGRTASGPPVTIWAQIFERQAKWVQVGQHASVWLPNLSAEEYAGQVQYVDTKVNRVTGTIEVRISLEKTPPEVKPNMYAVVRIDADPLDDVLLIPRDAVIETAHTTRVVVALGGGRFVQRTIQVERSNSAYVAVSAGLQEGDDVVVAAQFLLDSEASLEAGLQRLTTDATDLPPIAEQRP